MIHLGPRQYSSPSKGAIKSDDLLIGGFLFLCGYAVWDLVTAFSLAALGGWIVMLCICLLMVGHFLPDWGELEEVQKEVLALQSLLEEKGNETYKRELARILKDVFQVRDKARKARNLLEAENPDTLREELAKLTGECETARTEEHTQRYTNRRTELQETISRLEVVEREVADFDEKKKDWLSTLRTIRVRLETRSTHHEPPVSGGEIEEDLESLKRIVERVTPSASPHTVSRCDSPWEESEESMEDSPEKRPIPTPTKES